MPAPPLPNVSDHSNEKLQPDKRSSSPIPPPYSPITPIMSAPILPMNGTAAIRNGQYSDAPLFDSNVQNAAAFTQNAEERADRLISPQDLEFQPAAPTPISMSDNPDAIALRAAMSVLQIQRQQAIRDMKTLEHQKHKALEDPENFARNVAKGKIKARGVPGNITISEEGDGAEAVDQRLESANEATGHRVVGDEEINDPFGKIPSAQNVVRMPPINWAKYHIVGESLDKLHEDQRMRPDPGYPLQDNDLRPRERSEESVIAAPYNPWTDNIGAKAAKASNEADKKT